MGNTSSTTSEEQNMAAGNDALAIFKLIDVDADDGLTLEEWQQAFDALDAEGKGSITRKQWYVKQGTADMYDLIQKENPSNIRKYEWEKAFSTLDTNRDGKVSVSEWLARKKVQIGFVPLGLSLNHWGVGIGSDFYEVVSSQQEMAIAGPDGIAAYGPFVGEDGAKEKWQEAVKAEVAAGERDERTWLEEKEEPRSRPEDLWTTMEHIGWSAKSSEEIAEFIQQWVAEHPTYKAMDAFGRECNDQTFAMDFVSWLTDSKYRRFTDNDKGRVLLYGGLALLAGAGVAYLSRKGEKKKQSQGSDGADSDTTAGSDP